MVFLDETRVQVKKDVLRHYHMVFYRRDFNRGLADLELEGGKE